jgi:acyl-CoA reductase-like NAD-dependent aldehyde dehydrogenase
MYPATVLTDVSPDMPIFREEVFGPTCAVVSVKDDDEAIAIANDTPYGLSAGVITEDLGAGLALARRLQTGMVHVNDQSIADEPQAPFGGIKESGYGRFGGYAAIDAFTELRWITVQEEKKNFGG